MTNYLFREEVWTISYNNYSGDLCLPFLLPITMLRCVCSQWKIWYNIKKWPWLYDHDCRSKKVARFPRCCTFNSSSLGYNFVFSFTAFVSSINLYIPWYLWAFVNPNEINIWTYLDSREIRRSVCLERSWENPHRNANIFFKYSVADRKKASLYMVWDNVD